jgi:hypothetical protein
VQFVSCKDVTNSPFLEDRNQATASGGYNKLRKLVCVTVISAVLLLLVVQ